MSTFGESLNAAPDVVVGIGKFVSALYGKPDMHSSSVDDVRFAFFQQYYAPRKIEDPLHKIKGVNPGSMPPCSSTLVNKVLRANYVTYIWKKANRPCTTSAACHGWNIIDGQCQIKWFDCD